jgi:hypothetical protein
MTVFMAVQMLVFMGMCMVVGVNMVMFVSMCNTVMSMLMGMAVGVGMVMCPTAMVMVNMHDKLSFTFFFHYISGTGFCQNIYFHPNIPCRSCETGKMIV